MTDASKSASFSASATQSSASQERGAAAPTSAWVSGAGLPRALSATTSAHQPSSGLSASAVAGWAGTVSESER